MDVQVLPLERVEELIPSSVPQAAPGVCMCMCMYCVCVCARARVLCCVCGRASCIQKVSHTQRRMMQGRLCGNEDACVATRMPVWQLVPRHDR